jgi:hypothetical protein
MEAANPPPQYVDNGLSDCTVTSQKIVISNKYVYINEQPIHDLFPKINAMRMSKKFYGYEAVIYQCKHQ